MAAGGVDAQILGGETKALLRQQCSGVQTGCGGGGWQRERRRGLSGWQREAASILNLPAATQ